MTFMNTSQYKEISLHCKCPFNMQMTGMLGVLWHTCRTHSETQKQKHTWTRQTI